MNVKDLVKFKNDLLNTRQKLLLDEVISEKIKIIDDFCCRHEITDYTQDTDQCISIYKGLSSHNKDIITLVDNLIKKVEDDIILQVNKTVSIGEDERHLSNYLATSDSIEQIICTRISSYSNWKFPGLQLHCRYFRPESKNYQGPNTFSNPTHRINSMVACDPLYLVSTDKEHLNEIISYHNPIYRNRLRLYEITMRSLFLQGRNLSQLPYAQFGFILCWDFLNYLSIKTVEWYLNECIRLLRPGGSLMFSYNNGDIESSAKLFDQGRAAWATAQIIQKMIEEIGFDIIRSENHSTNDNEDTWVSWYEVKKPGELKTVRLNQAIGVVLTK
jgi:hypothetical protein